LSGISRHSRLHNSKIVGIVVVALIAVGLVALGPWLTGHFDLRVYYGATRSWIHGGELYAFVEHGRDRDYGFTYPPFGALVFTPLAVLPYPLAEVLFDAATVAVTVACWRCCSPRWPARGWNAGLLVGAGLVALFAFDPWRTTYNYGQVNMLLLAIVAADLLRKRGPTGVGVGLATAVKLVPAIFIGYLLLTRRFRAAAIATATAIGVTGLAWAVDPAASRTYWTDLLWRSERIGDPAFVSNQALNGLVHRLGHGPALWLALVVPSSRSGSGGSGERRMSGSGSHSRRSSGAWSARSPGCITWCGYCQRWRSC
jgi:alpha-1,2-mannosyltransferase